MIDGRLLSLHLFLTRFSCLLPALEGRIRALVLGSYVSFWDNSQQPVASGASLEQGSAQPSKNLHCPSQHLIRLFSFYSLIEDFITEYQLELPTLRTTDSYLDSSVTSSFKRGGRLVDSQVPEIQRWAFSSLFNR
ncbi:hypothetical protein EJ05DRAFT_338295 [Pseudovirgaria hyperparasitica]|uniref:Uncharacterized protein n=1 Tax=Pseudovirgaria hyperparasitica TaxID=470096 RepID=A0A6A6WDQ0_9PEZI|nr:uncharacterized protein EJ05DRAFT_338295 [Pseudovirgaria hyperparasitica]KAF2759241.1 hypothetical protein EJ05DRAFT_338295 [Pseudovirgaria hyperparasitica]